MYSLVSIYRTFLILVLTLMLFGVAGGCTDNFTAENSSESLYTNQVRNIDRDIVDELWVISSRAETRNGLTIEQIREIIETNKELYTTADGEIDNELLKRFVVGYFDNVDIITNPESINEILGWVYICCKYDVETKTIKITVVNR